MTFRDEREALRARAERAEEQLAEAQRELERLRAPVEEPPDPSPPSAVPPVSSSSLPRGARWGRRLAIVAVIGAGIGGYLLYLGTSLKRTAEATWHGVVKDGGGVVAPGTPCTLTGRFRGDGV